MRWHKVSNGVAAVLLVLTLLLTPAAGQPAAAQAPDLSRVEGLVLTQLAEKGQSDFFVWLSETADLTAAQGLPTKQAKGQFVYEALRETAARTQKDLRAFLDSQGANYQSFYIVNRIWVKGGSEALLLDLAARPDVARITANHTFQLDEPIDRKPSTPAPNYVEPNISFIKADQAWAMGATGQGMVVADDDTGIDHTHPTILPHYRGCLNPPTCSQVDHNYNWWDAWGNSPYVPWDDYGHGTHTTGTMVGDDGAGNQIGVAPGAQAIACKNMQGGGGDDAHFLICFEWNLAPWDLNGNNPRPDLAPDSVNNSWGYWGGGNDVFREVINNLQAAGIVVEVSAGNEGSGCQSLRSPGDYQEVFTTGSVNHAYAWPGLLTGFSSRGPSVLDGDYFPDFMAPGENVRSALPGNSYGSWSGTSMAGPHVTALIALIWSANPALRGQIDTTYDIIRQTVTPLTGQGGSNCGGDYVTGPNNDWGYGTIDALAAVQLAISYGGAGTLEGTVTDAVTGLPVAGATVRAVRQEGGTWTLTTNADGFYQATVAAGTFDMTVSHPHYQDGTANGVVVVEGGTTVQDLSLTPRGWLYGYVTDADNGTPIEGAVVADDWGNSATTDAAGYYELWLDPGTWNVTVVAQNYAPQAAMVSIVSGQGTQQDWALLAAVVLIPSPLDVTVVLGGSASVVATIINRLPWDYAFEFRERDQGFFVPPVGRVEVSVPASSATAPAGTAAAAGPYRARPAGSVQVQPRGRIQDDTNVLLLAADDDNGYGSPIQGMLLAYGDLGAVDLFDARYSTPTLDQLQAYQVVVTWSNYVYGDPAGVGNVLADYVDGGGKVVTVMFSMGTHGWQMAGRFMTEGYTALNGGGINYSSSCLGSYDAGHPIMDGVTDVCDYYRLAGTYLTAGSSEVARWQDGELFVAAKDDQTVASIAGYVGYYYQWTGQMADVLHNAINWLAVPADVPWLSEDPTTGTVPAGGSLPVTILFDASAAAGVTQPGDYLADLIVKGEPRLTVPVTMHVLESANTMHVGALGLTLVGTTLQARGRVHDTVHAPLPGALVQAQWLYPNGTKTYRTFTTGAQGGFGFNLNARLSGQYRFCVVGLVKAGYTYVKEDNHPSPPCRLITVP